MANHATPDEAPLRIGLVQINNSFSGQSYLPYSVGLLQAYITRHHPAPESVRFLMPLFSRERVADAVATDRRAS